MVDDRPTDSPKTGFRPFTKQDLDAVAQRKRRLPHWELHGSAYFVTFRTQPDVGQAFRFDSPSGIGRARVVQAALHFHEGQRYDLHAYVVMPDHVHLILAPLGAWSLAKTTQGIKGYTARVLNQLMGRRGPFWQDESFDHLIRDEADWLDKVEYVRNNPVNAGLVGKPEEYPFVSVGHFRPSKP